MIGLKLVSCGFLIRRSAVTFLFIVRAFGRSCTGAG